MKFVLFITACDTYYKKNKFEIQQTTYINEYSLYTYYSFRICSWQAVFAVLKTELLENSG